MKLLEVRWESQKEKELRLKYYATKANDKDAKSLIYCTTNTDFIISQYELFKVKYLKMLKDKEESSYQERLNNQSENRVKAKEKDDMINAIKSGAKYECQYCGGLLRYIHSHNFVGCSNFKDGKQHTNLNWTNWEQLNSYIPESYPIEISKKHLEYFRTDANIPSFVKLSMILKILTSNGVAILGDLTLDFYNNGRNAAIESKSEEEITNEILKQKFAKVNYQMGIKYKTSDSFTIYTKIPDYICQDENTIYVFDAKKSVKNLDYSQLDLYHSLVEIIAKESGSVKQIKSYFIIFKPEENEQELFNKRCLTINTLKSI